jgi:hypothetical protein
MFRASSDPLFMENYIVFLIKQELVVYSLYWLTNWQAKGYFQNAAKLKSLTYIYNHLKNQDSSNPYSKEYEFALNYDTILLNLAIRIH